MMQRAAAALFLLIASASLAMAADTPAPQIAIGLLPLGDNAQGVVARVTFRFTVPQEVPAEAMLELQGSFMQGGKVLRNFRFPVRTGEPGDVSTVQTFPAGSLDVEAKLMLPVEDGTPMLLLKSVQTFTIGATNQPYIASEKEGAEGVVAEGAMPESVGAVKILPPKRDVAPNLFIVDVAVKPPAQRIEFWVEGKKILARNAPPYRAELDLGKLPKRVEVRVVGYDAAGRYVDADAFVVNERETPLEVKITRTQTSDGVWHIKVSLQNPKNTNIRSAVLYAGDKKLHEWRSAPYAVDLQPAQLKNAEFLRASVTDDTGYEATDLVFLNGDRYIESIDVNLVELPVSVTDAGGAPIANLKQENFTVLENGKPQTITNFNYAANLPLSIGVLLDHSGSMEKRMKQAKEAAKEFFADIIKAQDRAFVGGFAMDPTKNAPFVSDTGALALQVDAVPDAGGGTSLYDAIVTGLYRFRDVQGRKALLVITDGEDTTSRLSYDDMLTYARASRVPLYFIGIGMGMMEMGGTSKMKTLAAESGGVAYFIKDVKQLKETYTQLEQDLRTQYLVSYQSETTKKDNAYRTIDVKVDRSDARVRTIRGFIP
ncbi:MAG TPA: VWA domain-containing protein [Thermoanaerobaculia bacterium]|nr:VWA domain-containing protein [Thermoanaerobaculia bacterium]